MLAKKVIGFDLKGIQSAYIVSMQWTVIFPEWVFCFIPVNELYNWSDFKCRYGRRGVLPICLHFESEKLSPSYFFENLYLWYNGVCLTVSLLNSSLTIFSLESLSSTFTHHVFLNDNKVPRLLGTLTTLPT